MSEKHSKLSRIGAATDSVATSPTIGRVESVDEDGCASVSYPASNGVAVPARSVVAAPLRAGEHLQDLIGRPVLLLFEDEDLERPIVMGFVQDRLRPEPIRPEVQLDLGNDRDVVVDGQRVVLDGQREVLLRCGKSSLLLRRDGKVIVRGTNLISRSSGPNKIKGGSISLN